jgi:hypothetical protein
MTYQKRVIIFLSVMAVLTGILIGAFVLFTENRMQNIQTQDLVPEEIKEFGI